MAYVDGFVVPVPKKKLQAYRRMSQKAGKIWRELGALEFRECVADDVNLRREAHDLRRLQGHGGRMSAPFALSRLLDAPRVPAAVADLFRAPGG